MAFTGRNDKYPCHLGTRGNSILVFFFPFLCVYPLTSFSCMETIPPSAQHIKITSSPNPGTGKNLLDQHAYSSGCFWLTLIESSCESNQQLHITNVQLPTLNWKERNKTSAGATPSIYPSLRLQLLTTLARHFAPFSTCMVTAQQFQLCGPFNREVSTVSPLGYPIYDANSPVTTTFELHTLNWKQSCYNMHYRTGDFSSLHL